MPGVGFYSIHTSKISFRSDGRWYADDEPVTHERLGRLFTRCLRRKASGGYEIWLDERYHADVEVEDTPYVVTAVSSDGQGEFRLQLNDGTSEPLDPDSLQVGSGNVLYCRVKQGAERARFLRPAYYEVSRFIEDDGSGRFQLRCGDTTHPIAQS